jgi:hypothetical protein
MFVAAFTATPNGPLPTATALVTVLLAPLITDTKLPTFEVAYTVFVVAFTATVDGLMPTGTVAVTG